MIMDVRIQAIHFDISEKLSAFINKKIDKLVRRYTEITGVDVTLKVVKPETAMNKEVVFQVDAPQHETLVATKTADTFEEAIDLSLEAVEKQLEKKKQKKII